MKRKLNIILNGFKLVLVLFVLMSCSSESAIPEHEPFPGFIKGELNGDIFEYDRGGPGRGSDFSYSASWQSAELLKTISIRFKTGLCPENNCEWEPVSSNDILEIINSTDWTISGADDIGISINYINHDRVYYSDINSPGSPDNFFRIDKAYIDEFDVYADRKEPFESIIMIEGQFSSTLTNAEDSNDQINVEATFKGFLDSESEW